ncbi:MAG TPA: hypothetical protein VFR31_10975 [Thermoanaerobaculia bacterium]|nr:hypothetical protein [Thermoanaerobaculia bacterium]
MSTNTAVLDENATTVSAPVDGGPVYVEGEAQIIVPVYPMPSEPEGQQVYAPPFVVPVGTWTVTYVVQDNDYLIGGVTYQDVSAGVTILENQQGSSSSQWTTQIRNAVTYANMMESTIVLNPTLSAPGQQPLRGDPTIAVVKDPLG